MQPLAPAHHPQASIPCPRLQGPQPRLAHSTLPYTHTYTHSAIQPQTIQEKEKVVDFRRNTIIDPPLKINGVLVKLVSVYRYPGAEIEDHFKSNSCAWIN